MAASIKGKSRGRVTLNILIAVLAIIFVFELFYDWETAIMGTGADDLSGGGSGTGLEAVDLDNIGPDYAAYVEAPVFDPDRLPLRLSTPQVGGGSSTLEDLTLIGTLISEDDRWAMFRVAGQPEAIRARPGESISDWTISRIDPGLVVLERGGISEELELARNKAPRNGGSR